MAAAAGSDSFSILGIIKDTLREKYEDNRKEIDRLKKQNSSLETAFRSSGRTLLNIYLNAIKASKNPDAVTTDRIEALLQIHLRIINEQHLFCLEHNTRFQLILCQVEEINRLIASLERQAGNFVAKKEQNARVKSLRRRSSSYWQNTQPPPSQQTPPLDEVAGDKVIFGNTRTRLSEECFKLDELVASFIADYKPIVTSAPAATSGAAGTASCEASAFSLSRESIQANIDQALRLKAEMASQMLTVDAMVAQSIAVQDDLEKDLSDGSKGPKRARTQAPEPPAPTLQVPPSGSTQPR